MDRRLIAFRYLLIRAEVKRHMTPTGKWRAMPALLNEMDDLRLQYRQACLHMPSGEPLKISHG